MWGKHNVAQREVATLNGPGAYVVDTMSAVREIGRELVELLWPLNAEVHLSTILMPVKYPEREFRRIMRILIGRALTASANDGNPFALVGSNCDGRVTLFSVQSHNGRAFRRDYGSEIEGLYPEGAEEREALYPMSEAKRIVEGNGGLLWVDDKFCAGSTTYFTAPHGGNQARRNPRCS